MEDLQGMRVPVLITSGCRRRRASETDSGRVYPPHARSMRMYGVYVTEFIALSRTVTNMLRNRHALRRYSHYLIHFG